MKRLFILLGAALMCAAVHADNFTKHFADSTLRLDYILSGQPGNVGISLKNAHKSKGWAGRRNHLDKNIYTGNANITVTSMDGDTIYTNSFSSLFSEWLDLNETTPTAHECTLLVPYPKDSVNITVNLLDKWHKPISSLHHTVDPKDILIRHNTKNPLPYTFIRKGSYPGHRISVAFLAEGYQPHEMEIFRNDAAIAVEALLEHEPFAEMKERFDFIAVETPSAESNVSVPKKDEWHDTAFKSHYSTFYSDRYLTSDNVFDMHNALNGIPYEHIIILVNTEEYGGGGIYNDYTLTAAHHKAFRPVVVHEFGHSFGGLADEYFYVGDVMDDTYPKDSEPWEPNITTLVDFSSKWQNMMPEGTPVPTDPADATKYPVGLYEGGGYSVKGVYRPADRCRMRDNEFDSFCPVCRQALRNLIIYYTE